MRKIAASAPSNRAFHSSTVRWAAACCFSSVLDRSSCIFASSRLTFASRNDASNWSSLYWNGRGSIWNNTSPSSTGVRGRTGTSMTSPVTFGMISTTGLYMLTDPAGAPHCMGMKSTISRMTIHSSGESFQKVLRGTIFSFTSRASTPTYNSVRKAIMHPPPALLAAHPVPPCPRGILRYRDDAWDLYRPR